jgi:hypothetical protein
VERAAAAGRVRLATTVAALIALSGVLVLVMDVALA